MRTLTAGDIREPIDQTRRIPDDKHYAESYRQNYAKEFEWHPIEPHMIGHRLLASDLMGVHEYRRPE